MISSTKLKGIGGKMPYFYLFFRFAITKGTYARYGPFFSEDLIFLEMKGEGRCV